MVANTPDPAPGAPGLIAPCTSVFAAPAPPGQKIKAVLRTNLAEMFGTKPSTAGNYSLTSGWVGSELLDQFVPIYNSGEGAGYFVPEEFLPQLTNVQIHGPVP